MIEQRTFDENNPFDAIAQMTKSAVTEAFLQSHRKARTISTDRATQIEALLSGLLVAACGCAMAMAQEDRHGELRAMLIAGIPDAFDSARDIAGLPPLGATQ